jgi:hypothetical protein
MKKIQAKPINPQCWILTEWSNRVGVLTQNPTGYTLLSSTATKVFDDLKSLESSLSWKIIFETFEPKEPVVDKIGNLPTRHTDPQNIEQEPIVSYTKTSSSSVRLAAGYWGIQYSHGWVGGFCPKLETLTLYPHVGPFSTKLELNTILNKKQKESLKEE